MTDTRITRTYTLSVDENTTKFPDLLLRQLIRQLAYSYRLDGLSIEMFAQILKDEADICLASSGVIERETL